MAQANVKSLTAIVTTIGNDRLVARCLRWLPDGLNIIVSKRASPDEYAASLINSAMSACITEWALVMHDDVCIRQKQLSRMYDFALACDSPLVAAQTVNDLDETAGEIVLDQQLMPSAVLNRRYGPKEVEAAYMICNMIRRSDFIAAGGLDTRFLLDGFDVDYDLRLRQAGHKLMLYVDNEFDVYHGSDGTPRQPNAGDTSNSDWVRFRDKWSHETLQALRLPRY